MKMNTMLCAMLSLAVFDVAEAKRSLADVEANAGSAQTVLVTQARAAGGEKVAGVDFQSDGNAFAFQFRIDMPKGISSVDTSDCLSGLPANFAGKCVASKDGSKVAVVVYTTGSEPLAAGIQELGTIRYRSNAKVAGSITVNDIIVSSKDGKKLGSSAKVVAVD